MKVWQMFLLVCSAQLAWSQPELRRVSVGTLAGEVVEVLVPSDIRPGDRITGSVASRSTLEGVVVEIEGKPADQSSRLFRFVVPMGAAAVPLLLRSADGKTIGSTQIPMRPQSALPSRMFTPVEIPPKALAAPGNYNPVYYAQPGQPMVITGNFDGDAANTKVQVGGKPSEVVAESPRQSICRTPEDVSAGKTEVVVEDRGVKETGAVQIVDVKISADRTKLLRNQRAKITVTVSPLENLNLGRDRFRVELVNLTPEAVRFDGGGGATQTHAIPAAAKGTFQISTSLTAIQAGSFRVQANLMSGFCRECWAQYDDCLAPIEREEKQCYKDCEKAGSGTVCFVACSTAARAQELECAAAYAKCFKSKLW